MSSPPHSVEEDHSAGSGSYQVVARRYRPKTFDELVGQSHVVQALSNALTSERVGHAYLFTGARGTGKTTSARIFAKALNCVEGPTLTPCGICDSCRGISTGEDIDVLEIDGASNRGIDEIRQLRQNASIRPSRSKHKIYIIDEVHMLTREAFNALLKILEEPPEHVKFIFCTTEPSKIPITVLSRCQRFDFAGIETNAIAQRLAGISANEHVTADDGVFEVLARRAAGSMRDAQSLLEQLLSFASENISLADVHDMLGTANDQLLFRLLDAMLHCEPAKIFTELEAAASEGVDFGVMVEQMMGLLRDLLVTASGGDASLLLFCSPPQFDQVKAVAEEFGIHRVLAALQILDQTYTRMRFSTQGRVLTELALIRIAHLDHFQQIAVLLDQLQSCQPATPSMAVKQAQRKINEPVAAKPEPEAQSPARSMQQTARQWKAVDFETITNDQAATVWKNAADAIPGMLGSYATKCIQVTFEKPNMFVAFFDNKMVRDVCEKESPRLQNALSQAVGKSVKIRLELAVQEKPKESAAENVGSFQKQREIRNAALESPLVKKVEEVFGATLQDVR
jgi:DNA polymerase-3 subunit gamma/tau